MILGETATVRDMELTAGNQQFVVTGRSPFVELEPFGLGLHCPSGSRGAHPQMWPCDGPYGEDWQSLLREGESSVEPRDTTLKGESDVLGRVKS